MGGCLLQIFGGVSAPNFRGGVCSKFSGGVCSKFSGGLQFSEYGQRSAGTHPTGMHSCLTRYYFSLHIRDLSQETCSVVLSTIVLQDVHKASCQHTEFVYLSTSITATEELLWYKVPDCVI